MKNLFPLIVLLLFSTIKIQSQALPKIVEEHFVAINQQKLSTITSLRIMGSFWQNGLALGLKIHKVRPDKWRQEIRLNTQKQIVVAKGATGWEINQFAGISEPQDYTPEKLKELAGNITIDSKLWFHYQNKAAFKQLENETINGQSAYKLEVKDALGKITHFWLDKTTKYILQSKNLDTEQVTTFEDYQKVEGILFPKTTKIVLPQVKIAFVFDTIQLNIPIDDALFSKTSEQSVKQIAKAYLKAFYDLDYQKLRSFYTSESFWVDPSTKVIYPNPNHVVQPSKGGDKIIADLQKGFKGVFDAHYGFEKAFYSREFVSIWGTYTYKIPAKYFQGLQNSEAIFQFKIPLNTLLIIKDGKILEHTEYGDWSNWLQQANAQINQ